MFTKIIMQVLLVVALVFSASIAMAEGTRTEGAVIDQVEDSLRQYDDISVEMDNGTLVVSGDVATSAERTRILDTVKRHSGNTPIRDDLRMDSTRKEREISRTDDGSQSVGEYIGDAAVTTAVKGKLLATKDVSSFEINVETHDGVVTLTGEADTKAHAEQAGRVAEGVDGVKRVENHITVKP